MDKTFVSNYRLSCHRQINDNESWNEWRWLSIILIPAVRRGDHDHWNERGDSQSDLEKWCSKYRKPVSDLYDKEPQDDDNPPNIDRIIWLFELIVTEGWSWKGSPRSEDEHKVQMSWSGGSAVRVMTRRADDDVCFCCCCWRNLSSSPIILHHFGIGLKSLRSTSSRVILWVFLSRGFSYLLTQ